MSNNACGDGRLRRTSEAQIVMPGCCRKGSHAASGRDRLLLPVAAASLVGLAALACTRLVTAEIAPTIHVRWRGGLSDEIRHGRERQFGLAQPVDLRRGSWAYDLLDTSPDNILALVTHPELVLADEPTANLDSETASGILALMRSLNEEKGVAFVVATHDQRVVAGARRCATLRDGRFVMAA